MKYERKSYPDGWEYAVITDPERPFVVTEKLNTQKDLFFLKSLKEAMDHIGIGESAQLNIPCLPHQQADRRFEQNQSFDLKVICNEINNLGFRKVHIFHPHSDVTEMGIRNFVKISNTDFVQRVLADIFEKTNETPILLSTDGGSYKWINKLADVLDFPGEVYGASKSRDAQTHKLTQMIDRQDFKGKNVLIVDDLCVFGGTFLGLASMLRERNVGKIFLAVSHITVPNPNPELSKAFDGIYCTNSKYDSYELDNLQIYQWDAI